MKAYHTSGGSSPSHIEMDNTVSAAQMVFRVLTWFVADVIVVRLKAPRATTLLA